MASTDIIGFAERRARESRDGGPRLSEKEIRAALLGWAASEGDVYWGASMYDAGLLAAMLRRPECWPHGADLTSAVARCVEYGLAESLELLLSLPPSEKLRRIYLRRVWAPALYVRARLGGYADAELEKRLVLLQRVWRARALPPAQRAIRAPSAYSRPTLETVRYFGFRHAMYFARWNRRARHKLLRGLRAAGRAGDCAVDGYCAVTGDRPESLAVAGLWP